MNLLRLLVLLCGLVPLSASAFEPFKVKDIRVEGIQRTEAGTVFSYLPVKVGDTLTEEGAAAAIKSLYATGFFKDVRLEVEDGVLVVVLLERPAIAQIEFSGNKEFPKDKLKEALKQIGLSEGRILDRSALERAEQEIKSQYLGKGKYGVQITTSVTPLERNRVAINFNIVEGEVAKIRAINVVGNKVFKDAELVDLFVLRTPGWLTWYSKNDQYSRQKLEGDLENLRSFYLNQGYLEFTIDSTQVSLSPDKKDVYITVNLTEGQKYTLSDLRLAGELIVPEAELRKLLTLKAGDVFSRERLTESTKRISDRLGNEGYAFANVNPVPEVNREKSTVAFTLFVDPGRRVYVRHINIAGNTTTRDEVIRREMRQLEGAWYSASKLQRSKQRVDKLGYFSEVTVDTVNVPGSNDQVDINVTVTERPTGSLLFGVGFSSAEAIILSAQISQANLFGTGNALSLTVNSGRVNKVYALSFTRPYFTDDGTSIGWDLYRRDIDTTYLSVTPYKTQTWGAGLRFGVPVSEIDTINYGASLESTAVQVFPTSPFSYQQFVQEFGEKTTAWLGTLGWARDGRDSAIYTTRGTVQRVGLEVAVPPAEQRYYRTTYEVQWFNPVSRNTVLQLTGRVGYADGYQNLPVPFYKNFYAGGVNSVRGYQTASIGPKDPLGFALGGTTQVIANAEWMFPFPGLEKDKSVRWGAFVDAGAVGDSFKVDFNEMRYSTGVALSWFSPVGPLKLSLGFPLNAQVDDRKQLLQFSLGQVF
jgi:outer membrane protein insertion porin family